MSQRTNSFGEFVIDSFRDEHYFLSNFYQEAPLVWNGVAFASSEHAYQWSKTLIPAEQESVLFFFVEFDGKILKGPNTPGQSKQAGKKVTLRPDWEDVRLGFMYEILKAKFTQNSELRQKLLDTDDAMLIEGNTWCDNFWGSCTCPDCKRKEKKNMLGLLLMRLRTELSNDLTD